MLINILLELMFGYILFDALKSGKVLMRTGHTFSKSENPKTYWFTVALVVIFFLFSTLALVAGIASNVRKSEDVAKTKELQSYIPALEQTGVIYFRDSAECRKLQYSTPQHDGQYWIAEPVGENCAHQPPEERFNSQHQLVFNHIRQILSDPTIGSVIVAHDGSGKITSAEFNAEYIYNPDFATWPVDRDYLIPITGLWYRVGYHPSPF